MEDIQHHLARLESGIANLQEEIKSLQSICLRNKIRAAIPKEGCSGPIPLLRNFYHNHLQKELEVDCTDETDEDGMFRALIVIDDEPQEWSLSLARNKKTAKNAAAEKGIAKLNSGD